MAAIAGLEWFRDFRWFRGFALSQLRSAFFQNHFALTINQTSQVPNFREVEIDKVLINHIPPIDHIDHIPPIGHINHIVHIPPIDHINHIAHIYQRCQPKFT